MTFRPATVSDATFIARGFHAAMLIDDAPESQINTFAQHICSRDDVLYSWRNTIIALVDGTPAGMVTAYEGSRYRDMRLRTMALIKKHLGKEFPEMEDETAEGEFYIDSLAVLPQYRGQHIGKQLLQQAISKGLSLRLTVTLAVDPVNVRAQSLYASLGFKPAGELFIFGHTYWKMAIGK